MERTAGGEEAPKKNRLAVEAERGLQRVQKE